ncbi:MAG TPA: SIR2 family protein [Anaerolineales bacterium]|nr:SIR2 family protein [Anaerolineales bacterium]
MDQDYSTGSLQKIISLKNINNVVPIISNAFRIEQIFRDEKSLADLIPKKSKYTVEDPTINEQLTRIWAEQIHYPMADDYKLWRVAQYYQVEQDGSDIAKEEYLEFLKGLLLQINEKRDGYEEFVEAHKRSSHLVSFSDIVKGLDYPQFPEGMTDPLTLLAMLPFPIYITTSYHDFLERALERVSNNSKKPRTQVIFWEPGREYDDAIVLKHDPDPSYNPTPTEPAVYHLFGLENYPGSLVLSEDDYMKFLVSVVSDTDTQKPIVPPRLRRALATSHLLLMGYHLRELDFRVLFRFILNYRQSELAKQGICIQLKPKREDPQILRYLRRYFNMKKFEIEWKSSEHFVEELWGLWKDHQR